MSDYEEPFSEATFDTGTRATIDAARAMIPQGVETLESAQVLATIAVAEATLSLHAGLQALYRLLDERLKD